MELPPFVSAAWLDENYNSVVVCDVRAGADSALARADYEVDHLPGAVFVDLNSDLSAPPGSVVGRHPLHDPIIFAATMGLLGIGDDARVVAYDNASGGYAARLVWMLRALGTPAAVLDGGMNSWTGPLESGEVEVAPAERSVMPWPEGRLADADDVRNAIASGIPVVDSRAAERFRGEVEPLDDVAGHIPGAVNLPFTDHLESGLLADEQAIRDRFAEVGVTGGDEAELRPIIYCGSGVTACVNILAAEAAGLGPTRLYVGSWSGWSTTEGAQVATG